MHEDLVTAVEQLFPSVVTTLEELIRIPSVSAADFDAEHVHHSAEAVANALHIAGLENVRLLEIPDAHPAVFGQVPGPSGAPTVLLYAHHDVQPPGPEGQWTGNPFEPEVREGRLYGRGSSDDKAGFALHLGALLAHDGAPPVGVKVFVEGEEEIGSLHLDELLASHRDLLVADVIVIADSENWRLGTPALTTSLRGLVDCVVEVRTLEHGVHSGGFGGAVPDALTCLVRLLATLHDDEGDVAVAGLVRGDAELLDMSEDELRANAGVLEGTVLIGTGPLTSRMWARPACSVLAIDAPPVAKAINQLVPAARAKVSLRIAPGDDPARAMDALVAHLESHAPWGAWVSVTRGTAADAIALDAVGPAHDAFREGLAAAWGREPVHIGVGGSIPIVAAFREAFPEAAILLTGVSDPASRPHGPDESLDLGELQKGILAEAIALRLLAS